MAARFGIVFVFCPVRCFIIVFSGSCLVLWSPCWRWGSWLLWFSLGCGMSTACRGFLFFVLLVLFGRLCSVIVPLPGYFLYYINKTYLYNFDPLKPYYYIVKLGFTEVDIIFLISAKNIDCGYSLEPHYRGCSNEYPQSMFWAEIWKISDFFLSANFQFFGGKIYSIF